MGTTIESILLSIIVLSFLSIAYSIITRKSVLSTSFSSPKIQEMASTIRQGVKTYAARQYIILAAVGAVIFSLLAIFFSIAVSFGYLVGATVSGVASFIAMSVASTTSAKTAEASEDGLANGLSTAFKSGAFSGTVVIGLVLLALTASYYLMLKFNLDEREIINVMVALGLGTSLTSMFTRLGGGIFAKGLGLSADSIAAHKTNAPGKAYIHTAKTLSNIGDSVSNSAGVAAGLCELYANINVTTMVLSSIFFRGDINLMVYPLTLVTTFTVTTILGSYVVTLGKHTNATRAVFGAFATIAIAALAILYPLTDYVIGLSEEYAVNGLSFTGASLYYCTIVGLITGGLLMWLNVYYTGKDHGPVYSIAASSENGHASNILQGLGISLNATIGPVLILTVALLCTNMLAGLYGIALAATSMLGLAGMAAALGIFSTAINSLADMAEIPALKGQVSKIANKLSANGQATKAATKIYLFGLVGFCGLIFFAAYTEDIKYFSNVSGSALEGIVVTFDLSNPYIIVGLLIGSALTYVYSSMSIQAAVKTSAVTSDETTKHLKNTADNSNEKQQLAYTKLINLLSTLAMKKMATPVLLLIITPFILYFLIFAAGGQVAALASLGAMQLGVYMSALFMAISMSSGGAAWHSAKQHIADCDHGGIESQAYQSSMTGDAVGKPCDDLLSNAITPMIHTISCVTLLLLAIIAV